MNYIEVSLESDAADFEEAAKRCAELEEQHCQQCRLCEGLSVHGVTIPLLFATTTMPTDTAMRQCPLLREHVAELSAKRPAGTH